MPTRFSLLCALLLGLSASVQIVNANEPTKVELVRRSKVYERIELEFVLSLPKNQKIYFVGTGPTSPAYELQLLESGQWKDYEGEGWCGNALDIRETSKKAYRLKMSIDPSFAGKKTFRVGVKLFREKPTWDNHLPESNIIWSDAVTP